MGIFKTLENVGRWACGLSDSQIRETEQFLERKSSEIAWKNEHRNDYQCKYCGASSYSISNLTSRHCDKSPSGYHIPY